MKNKSFTLIELLVVIVIIGILAGVIMISTSSSINKANIAKSKVFEESIKDKLLLNLVSEWSFDTGPTQANSLAVSDDIKDIWGSYNAQIGPYAPTVKNGEDCISGKCLYFDGNDCIYVADHNAFDIENEITVSVWVFPQENVYGIESYIADNSMFRFHHTRTWTDTSYFYVYHPDATTTLLGLGKLLPQKWYFLVATYSKNLGMFSYVNASLYDSNSFSSPGKDLVKSLTQLNIGADEPTSSFFKGKMDEFKIYNAALSSSQIKQNYIAGLNSLLNNGNMSKKEYEENINKLSFIK